jgi:hypothetical protein
MRVRTIQFNDARRTPEEFANAYLDDEDLRELYLLLTNNKEQVPWETVVGQSQEAKSYWQQWERLRIVDGKMCRVWTTADGCRTRLQFIPRGVCGRN